MVTTAGVKPLDGSLPILELPGLPGSAGLERQADLDLARREDARAHDGDRADGEPWAAGDRDHDLGAGPVVGEVDLGRADHRVGIAERPEICQQYADAVVQGGLAEEAATKNAWGRGLDALGELVGGNRIAPRERDRFDGDPGALVDDQANHPDAAAAG